jgi:hypothetical protein
VTEAATPGWRRAVVGGAIGLLFFLLDAAATLIRVLLNPAVAERVTSASLLVMLLYLPIFAAAGALGGWLWLMRARLLRFVAIGALAGALVWSYLTATWPLTARAGAVNGPQSSVLDAALIGAGGGALGGALLAALGLLRRRGRDAR